MKTYLFLSISLCALTLYAADNQQTGLDVDPEEVTIEEQAWNFAKKQVIAAHNIEQNNEKLNEIPEGCDATPFAKWLKKQFDIQNDSEEDISAEVTRWVQHFLATQISSGEEDRDGSVAHSAQGGLIVSGQPGIQNVNDDEAERDDDSRDDDAPDGWMPQMPSLAGVSTAPRRLIGAIASVPANVIEGARQRWPFSAPAE